MPGTAHQLSKRAKHLPPTQGGAPAGLHCSPLAWEAGPAQPRSVPDCCCQQVLASASCFPVGAPLQAQNSKCRRNKYFKALWPESPSLVAAKALQLALPTDLFSTQLGCKLTSLKSSPPGPLCFFLQGPSGLRRFRNSGEAFLPPSLLEQVPGWVSGLGSEPCLGLAR